MYLERKGSVCIIYHQRNDLLQLQNFGEHIPLSLAFGGRLCLAGFACFIPLDALESFQGMAYHFVFDSSGHGLAGSQQKGLLEAAVVHGLGNGHTMELLPTNNLLFEGAV